MSIRCVPCELNDQDRGLVVECDIQSGGKNQVVVLGPGWRVRHVDVAELVLPTQPLADLGDAAKTYGHAVFARVLQIGKEIQVLRDDRALAHLVTELIPQVNATNLLVCP